MFFEVLKKILSFSFANNFECNHVETSTCFLKKIPITTIIFMYSYWNHVNQKQKIISVLTANNFSYKVSAVVVIRGFEKERSEKRDKCALGLSNSKANL
jgi:hypothetical protein